MSYKEHFYGLLVALEVQGWTTYTTESEFNALKSAIEADNLPSRPQYSVRKCRDNCVCETYIVK